MRAYWFAALGALVSAPAVQALSETEFQGSLGRLQSRQHATDQLLKRFGAQSGFEVGEERADAQSETKRGPLFKIHGELKAQAIPSGKLLFGQLVNRLVVGADGSPALIELDEGQGSLSKLRLMGTARQAGSPGRVSVEVNRLLLRSGQSVVVQAVALDEGGAFGLLAQTLSGKTLAVVGAVASSFVSGLAAGQQTQTAGALGFSQVPPTGRNALLQGVAQTAADQSKRLIEEATAEKPVLIVEALTPVTVLVQEEVRL